MDCSWLGDECALDVRFVENATNLIIDPAMRVTRNFSQNWGYKGGAHRESFRPDDRRESVILDRCSFGQHQSRWKNQCQRHGLQGWGGSVETGWYHKRVICIIYLIKCGESSGEQLWQRRQWWFWRQRRQRDVIADAGCLGQNIFYHAQQLPERIGFEEHFHGLQTGVQGEFPSGQKSGGHNDR